MTQLSNLFKTAWISVLTSISIWIFCTFSSASAGANLYLVGTGPREGRSPLGPHSATIYRVIEPSDTLSEIWTLPDNEEVSGVEMFLGLKLFAFAADRGVRPYYYLFSTDSVIHPIQFDLSGFKRIQRVGIVRPNDMDPRLYIKSQPDGNSSSRESLLNLDGRVAPFAGNSFEDEFRIAGLGSPYWKASTDIIVCRMIDGGLLTPAMGDHIPPLPPIPDSIVSMKSSNGWNIIAIEPSYVAVLSVPDRHGYDSRELLVLDRDRSEWTSMLVKGSQSAPRLFGNWLAGTVADVNPDTDYEKHIGYPPVLRNELFVISPLDSKLIIFDTGDSGEVLCVCGSEIIYRIGAQLYRGTITDSNVEDRKLLLEDRRVRTIHWAFHRSES